MSGFTKWVACWGNATSIRDQTDCTYTKDLTLRYPLRMCFSGDAVRIRFSNIRGTEPVRFTASCAYGTGDKTIDTGSVRDILFDGSRELVLQPGEERQSDVIEMDIHAGDTLTVSMYMKDYTQMNSAVLITGPLSKGFYSYGDHEKEEGLPLDLTRKTGWFTFLNTADIRTLEENHAVICYGDSITAQDWPDMLIQRIEKEGPHNVSIIRRAISGTRILREYDSITYAAYGTKGETRFPLEMNTAGADTVLIQHGINDIIHPVGTDVNPFRPWSDLPTAEELAEGVSGYYLDHAEALGLTVYAGTLLPIKGWRTHEPFRDELKDRFNDWLRTEKRFAGCADFDMALRDPADPEAFAPQYDSGDHLHPSDAGYRAMADTAYECLFSERSGR